MKLQFPCPSPGYLLNLLFFFCAQTLLGSSGEPPVDTLGKVVDKHEILLEKPWSFCKKDVPVETLDSCLKDAELVELPLQANAFDEGETPVGWLEKRLYVPERSVGKRFGINIIQWGACEIYLDQERFASIGKVGVAPSEEVRKRKQIDPPLYLRFDESGVHQLQIRFSDHAWEEERGSKPRDGIGVARFFFLQWEGVEGMAKSGYYLNAFAGGIGAFFTALGFLHLLIFIFYRKKASNLYYSLFMLLYGGIFILGLSLYNSNDPKDILLGFKFFPYLMQLFFVGLLTLIYSMLRKNGFGLLYWSILGVWGVFLLIYAFGSQFMYGLSFLVIPAVLLEGLRVIVISLFRGEKGSWILGIGAGFFILFLIGATIILAIEEGNLQLEDPVSPFIALGALFSIPLSMSLYLARDFATTSKGLERKLQEVEELSEKNLQQEREKQRILEEKKEELEQKVEERTAELKERKEEVEDAHQEIKDSIHYAKRIQEAVLPDEERYDQLGEHFILFHPRDPVSGDFHWGRKEGDHFYIAAVDCTGHGVPGAFMSMLGISFLNEIIANDPDASPGELLTRLKERVVKELTGKEGTAKDGMDAALLKIPNPKSQIPTGKEVEVQFAGANNPLYVVKKEFEEGEALPGFRTLAGLSEERLKPFKDDSRGFEVKGDKGAIGFEEYGGVEHFETVSLQLERGDMLYIFSDGYADQFGGEKGKKFRYGPFKRLLANLCEKPPEEQKMELERSLRDWKGEREQIDDVLVIGVRL